ncbi:MAG: SusC/RagA family TonB-linked outer membrane protein, partial [Bacteroidetes bacterium]|nr:SusC/RagA family TonB-linked outer membrane protein [Bacteroidota bacterium]
MRKILLVLVLLGCILWQPVQAQERRITGTVTDATTGDQLPGVSILIKGTSTGTVTDMNGAYALSAEPTATLVYSFIGYVQQEVAVNNRSVIDVRLSEDVEQLSEVVVVGYGTQEKKDATGAVESVKAEDFNQGVIASPEQLIQGKSAGVQITGASGEPGAGVNIRIRGTSSVRGGNNPLFVIDGVPLAGDEVSSGGQNIGRGTSAARNPLNFLNPNDIASIDILKDASATAIYGSRGANGVVLITTKSGRGNKQRIEFGTQVSVSTPANKFDLLDREQFLSAIDQYGGDRAEQDQGANTDWQDVVLRRSLSHKQDLSYANAYETGDYRVSLGYQNQQGIVHNSSLERLSARLNWNQGFFNDKLKLGVQGTISRLNDEQAAITDNAGFEG